MPGYPVSTPSFLRLHCSSAPKHFPGAGQGMGASAPVPPALAHTPLPSLTADDFILLLPALVLGVARSKP